MKEDDRDRRIRGLRHRVRGRAGFHRRARGRRRQRAERAAVHRSVLAHHRVDDRVAGELGQGRVGRRHQGRREGDRRAQAGVRHHGSRGLLRAAQERGARADRRGASGKTFNKGHYSLVVKDPALKSLADLKGKKVSSNHFASPKYVSKVAFDGKTDVEKDFMMVKASAPSKPLKDVEAGRADAALIDDEQLAQMKEIAPDLKVDLDVERAAADAGGGVHQERDGGRSRGVRKGAAEAVRATPRARRCASRCSSTSSRPSTRAAFSAAEKRYDKVGGREGERAN